MNKTVIYDFASNKVLAIAENSDTAHLIAETLSYVKNGNAIYGLYKMGLRSKQEAETDQVFARALTDFNKK